MVRISTTIIITAFLVGAGWLAWGHFATDVARWALSDSEVSEAGAWGDSYGAFNAGFSALGFTAMLGTLLLQARTLRRQQDDQHCQQFDSSFFDLLSLLRDLREKIRFRHSMDYIVQKKGGVENSSRSTKYGLEAITAAAREIRFWIGKHRKTRSAFTEENIVSIYYGFIHKRHENRIAAYFRIIMVILDRIEKDEILTDDEKEHYVSIVRGVLTTYELGLVAINGLMASERKTHDLIVWARLLKYMSDGLLRRTLEGFYPAEAFDGRLMAGEPEIPESEEESAVGEEPKEEV